MSDPKTTEAVEPVAWLIQNPDKTKSEAWTSTQVEEYDPLPAYRENGWHVIPLYPEQTAQVKQLQDRCSQLEDYCRDVDGLRAEILNHHIREKQLQEENARLVIWHEKLSGIPDHNIGSVYMMVLDGLPQRCRELEMSQGSGMPKRWFYGNVNGAYPEDEITAWAEYPNQKE